MFNNNINILIASSCGSLACISSLIALFPVIVNTIKLSFERRLMIKIAKIGIVIAIFLGLIHGLIETQKQEINFYDLQTYWVYAEGLFALNFLIFLSFCLGEITINMKKLTYFTYAGLFLVGCHVWQHLSI